ncbi:hypothetical protein VPHK45_0048 [Vibrio phage K45]
MAKKYFKTNDPLVVAAHSELVADSERLVENCKKFAAQFGGVNLMSTSMTGRSFSGLVMDDWRLREDNHLWTVPDSHNATRPRSTISVKNFKQKLSLKGLSADEIKVELKKAKADLVELTSKYYDNREDMEPVSFDPFFKSFGTDWGNLMFSGLRWFPHDGHIYFETGADFRDRMTEILGSEFEAAEAAQKEGE